MEQTRVETQATSPQSPFEIVNRIMESAAKERYESDLQIEALNEQIEKQKAEIARLEAQLKDVNTRDTITELRNRNGLVDQIEVAVERFRRTGTPCSSLVIGIDGFDDIVEKHGEACGVRYIQQASRLLLQVARKVDFVARLEGPKFVVLLPDTDRDGAALSAERHKTVFEMTEWPEARITISVGASTLNNHVETPYRFVDRADEALTSQQALGSNGYKHIDELHEALDVSLVA